MDEVERVAFGVLEVFEDPGSDLTAAIGEGDFVELVLDDGGGFGGGCYCGCGGSA